MQKRIFIKCLALMLALCTLLPFAMSCSLFEGDDKTESETGSAVVDEDERGYEFPEGADFGGKTYQILNCLKNQWEQQCAVTEHELTGTPINKAIYTRTAWLQNTLNCTLEETNLNFDTDSIKQELDISIDSGDFNYGAAYMQVYDIASEMISNRLTQLDYVENMHLDESYWNRELMNATTVNNRHYSAISDAHLMHFDGSWAIFFNKKMLEAYDMELPYELVRNKEWTFDKLITMSRQFANLNGDNSWELNLNGNAQYGYVTNWVGVGTLLFSVDAHFGKKDLYDMPFLTCGTPDFTTKAQEVADFCAEAGTFYFATSDNNKMEEKGDALFINQRVAFAGTQLCFMSKFTAADVEFGIVPYPMYDEDQEDYNVSSSVTAPFMTIPYGYAHVEDIGLIMDAMSYEADRTLEKVYYHDHLQLKSNTGEELANIEMLNLIREKRSCDVMIISGLDKNLHMNMCYAVKNGGGTIASTYQKYSSNTEKQFAKLRLAFGIK